MNENLRKKISERIFEFIITRNGSYQVKRSQISVIHDENNFQIIFGKDAKSAILGSGKSPYLAYNDFVASWKRKNAYSKNSFRGPDYKKAG